MGSKSILPAASVMQSTHLPVSVSGTNTYYSQNIGVKNLDSIGLQMRWTGTPTGTFTVEHSPDAVYWDTVPVSPSITQPAGSSGNWTVVISGEPYPYLRVKYVNASGSGTVDVVVHAKDWN